MGADVFQRCGHDEEIYAYDVMCPIAELFDTFGSDGFTLVLIGDDATELAGGIFWPELKVDKGNNFARLIWLWTAE